MGQGNPGGRTTGRKTPQYGVFPDGLQRTGSRTKLATTQTKDGRARSSCPTPVPRPAQAPSTPRLIPARVQRTHRRVLPDAFPGPLGASRPSFARRALVVHCSARTTRPPDTVARRSAATPLRRDAPAVPSCKPLFLVFCSIFRMKRMTTNAIHYGPIRSLGAPQYSAESRFPAKYYGAPNTTALEKIAPNILGFTIQAWCPKSRLVSLMCCITPTCHNPQNAVASPFYFYFPCFHARCSKFPGPSRPVMRHAYVDPPKNMDSFPFFATSVFKFNFENLFSRRFPLVFPFISLFLSTLYLSEPFKPRFIQTI